MQANRPGKGTGGATFSSCQDPVSTKHKAKSFPLCYYMGPSEQSAVYSIVFFLTQLQTNL